MVYEHHMFFPILTTRVEIDALLTLLSSTTTKVTSSTIGLSRRSPYGRRERFLTIEVDGSEDEMNALADIAAHRLHLRSLTVERSSYKRGRYAPNQWRVADDYWARCGHDRPHAGVRQ